MLDHHHANANETVDQILQRLRDTLPLVVLLARDAIRSANAAHRILREYLYLLGRNYLQHPGDNRIIYSLPAQFYDNLEHVEKAHRRPGQYPEPAVGKDGVVGASGSSQWR